MIEFLLNIIKEALAAAHAKYEDRLSDDERELLTTSAANGELLMMQVDVCGSWLRAGGRDFIDQGDPSVAARYLEAFERMCRRGYVRHEGGLLFRLTGTGFKVARNLGGSGPAVIEV